MLVNVLCFKSSEDNEEVWGDPEIDAHNNIHNVVRNKTDNILVSVLFILYSAFASQ